MFPRQSGWTRTGLPAGWLAKRGAKSYDFLAMDGTHLDRKVRAMEFALERGSREDAELVKSFTFEVKEVKKEAVEVREERGEQRLRFKGRLEGSQLAGLERAFSQRPYPSQEEREQLAGLLHLPSSVVRNWFQNKRSKGKEVRPKEEVERIAVSRDVTMVKAEPLAVTPPTIPAAAPSLGTFSFNFSSRREAYQVILSSWIS